MAAACVRCGREVFPFQFRVGRPDETPAPLCPPCRGGKGGRAQAERAATRKASAFFDAAFAARERKGAR